jgi:hypothetical protein
MGLKHIIDWKLFENDAYNIFNDLMKSRKEYYEKIIRSSWDKDVVNRVEVTESFQKIRDMIQKKLGDNSSFSNIQIKKAQLDNRIVVEGDFFQGLDIFEEMKTIASFFPRKRRIDFGIDILNDEWFLIHLNYGDGDYIFFKCDQFEGLEKFIEDLPTIALYYHISIPESFFSNADNLVENYKDIEVGDIEDIFLEYIDKWNMKEDKLNIGVTQDEILYSIRKQKDSVSKQGIFTLSKQCFVLLISCRKELSKVDKSELVNDMKRFISRLNKMGFEVEWNIKHNPANFIDGLNSFGGQYTNRLGIYITK